MSKAVLAAKLQECHTLAMLDSSKFSMSKITRTSCAFSISALLWLTIGTAEAEFIGLNIDASHWESAPTSSFDNTDSDSIDLIDDLDVDDPSHSSMTFILEHPITALPNIRYQGSQLDSNVNLPGETFSSGNQVSSTFDLSHDDIVLYYQLLNNWVDLDLGIDVKRLDGEVSFAGATSSTVAIDETIPLLYMSARFDLPLDGLYVGANINANVIDLGISESSAQDSTIMLGYESGTGLGIEGGFKYFSLDLDNVDEPDTDLEYDGVFLNGYINF
jgi:outer membrane protein